MTRFQRLALAALPLLGLAGAAMLSAQTSGLYREAEVAGWHIEDVATPSEDDPHRREIRMRRGDEDGGPVLALILTIGIHELGEDWEMASYEASVSNGGQFCGNGGSIEAPSGSAAERARGVRAALERRILEVSQRCGSAQSLMPGHLDGFDAAFARLSAWQNERQIQLREALTAMDPDNVSVGYFTDTNMIDDNMTMVENTAGPE